MTHSETLWTGFDGRGLYARLAEFALKDRDGNPIEASQVKDARVDGDTLYITKTDGTVIEFSMPDISGKVDKVDGTPGHLVQFGESGAIADSGKGIGEIETAISAKTDKTYVDTALASKADKTYVDTELAKKADKTYVDTALASKADKTYVDSAVAPKAEKTYVDEKLSGKVDKVAGKGLSSNDFTDAEKEKLGAIGNLPAAEDGEDTTLVTTGDKWRWDHNVIEYYLANAEVVDDTLIIYKSDGTEVTFEGGSGGSSPIQSIWAYDTELVPVNKKVTIPLAVADTPGVYGSAGLVQGMYQEFQQ